MSFYDILRDEPLDRWYTLGNVIAIVDARLEDTLSPQADYLLASEAASAGMVVLSRVQQASAAEADAVVAHLNRALAGCHCARRFGADVLRKVWDTLTDADFARLDHCGWQQTSYVKLHFDEHEAFTSLYFLEIGRTVEQLRAAAQTLLHDARYGHVLRIKGFIPADGGWVELNAARDAITVQPIPNGQEVLIVIGEGLDKAAIEAVVKTVVNIYSPGINIHPPVFPATGKYRGCCYSKHNSTIFSYLRLFLVKYLCPVVFLVHGVGGITLGLASGIFTDDGGRHQQRFSTSD